MPSIFRVGSYCIYFWSNENGEPVHVHISVGRPVANATKVWLTRTGGCIVANNRSDIPAKDLSKLLELISAQHFLICGEWKKHFVVDTLDFYC